MTEQDAIKAIENDLEWHSKELKPKYKEALKLAIQALEKQISKNLDTVHINEKMIYGYCPTCQGTVQIRLTWLRCTKGKCCDWCGQKLKWSD